MEQEMHAKQNSTCRPAWTLRRQVLHGPPMKGDLASSVAAIETSCNVSGQTTNLRGERISAGVSWAEPREKPPSGLANAAQQNRPPGSSRRAADRLDGNQSRRGVVQPGPGAKRDGAYPIHDLSRRQSSPGAMNRPARSFQRLVVAFGGSERLIHETDGRQTRHESILR